MRTSPESIRGCRRCWRISLGDALEKKARGIFGNVETDFEIGTLASDFRRSGEEWEIRLIEVQPLCWILMNAIGQIAGRIFR